MADQRLVTVREAARLASVPKTMVHWLLEQGLLPTQPGPQGPLIPRAAIRALLRTAASAVSPPPRGERAPAPDPREYVPPYVAARMTGVQPSIVSAWSRRGMVTTMGGTYGRLVRLADVQALAKQRRAVEGKAGEGEGQP